jgi:hypothetical protein
MFAFRRFVLKLGFVWLTPVLVIMLGPGVRAQANVRVASEATNKSIFERITLKNRKVIVGLMVGTDRDGNALVAVSRAWLQKNEPLHPKLAQESEDRERIAYTQIRDRVKELLKNRDDWPVPRVLEMELERAEKWLDATEHIPSQLFFVTLPKKEIARIDSPGPNGIRQAQWAWFTGLKSPETTNATSISKLLEEEHVPWRTESPELGDRFPARPQDDREWTARVALFRYSHVEAIAFQGTNDLMFRSGMRDATLELGPIISQLLNSQMQSLLNDLTGQASSKLTDDSKPLWLQAGIKEAEKLDKDYLRATSVVESPTSGEVTVESSFAFRLPDDRWETIWTAKESHDANRQDRKAVERIERDPQIESLKKTFSALGIGGNNEQIDLAIRVGAATMQAQQNIDSRFEKVRQRYMKRLDLPLLLWETSLR